MRSDKPELWFEWHTASPWERLFVVVYMALWLTGLGAVATEHAYRGNPDIHPTAEAVCLAVWIAGASLLIGQALWRRLVKRGRP